ncbi:gliding motility-associated C-terminal domain-containing protein [Cytophaga hutchinsonii]|nr:gliding motility-associated C-terminal domain-containing protein [Cytophaga hutchinsonii]
MRFYRQYIQHFFVCLLILTVSIRTYAAGITVSVVVNGNTVIPGPSKTVFVCKGGIYNLKSSNIATPPPAGLPIYEWKNLDSTGATLTGNQINTFNAGRWVSTIKYYNTSTGTYTSASDTVHLVYTSSSSFAITTTTGAPVSGTNINICGSIDSTFLVSPGFTDYKWYKNSTTNLVSSTNSLTFTNAVLSASEGTVSFFVTAKNSSGCDVSAQQNVRRDNSVVVDLGPDISPCLGTPVTLSSPSSTPPNVVISYRWNTNAITQTISVNTSGKYKLTISNLGSKCRNTDSVNVTFLTGPSVTISKDTTICKNTSVQLNAQATGTGTYTYSWSPAAGLSNSSISNPIATPVNEGPTTYTVSVTGSSGCGSGTTKSTKVTVLPAYATAYGSVDAGNDTSICYLSGAQLAPTTTSLYPATYSWSWSPATGLSSSSIQNPTLTLTTPGIQKYVVTATDDRGCAYKDSVNVTNLSELTTTTNFLDSTICADTPIRLFAFASGGSLTGYSFNFTPAIDSVSGNILTLYPIDSTYHILVSSTDSDGCTSPEVDVTIKGYRPYVHIANAMDTIGYGGNPLVLVANIASNPDVTVDWYEQYTDTYLSSGLTYTSTTDQAIYAFATDSYYTCFNRDSVSITHIDADLHALFIPNVFSPKASNPENQHLKVYGTYIQEEAFSFRIYNQWGQLVYQTNSFIEANTLGWSGEFKGNEGGQSTNVYTYTLEGKFYDGLAFNKAGTATMLR